MTTTNYVPKVDDYVKWRKLEGWVYFKCADYITIEIGVRDKPDDCVDFHKKVHCLILCYCEDWPELKYVKSRDPETHEEIVVDASEYKSQEHRYSDLQ